VVANRLLKIIEQAVQLEGQEIIINVSIGITCCPGNGDEINTLLRQADLAMYAAKRNNEGFVFFDASLEQHKQQHLSLMAELRQAIANEELTLYFQPKLELATNTITHVEALVRWIHPERGLVPPNDFIPFAEHTGFIKFITLWVIEAVMRQQKIWLEMGVRLTISINISARDLFIKNLPSILGDLMRSYQVAPETLILEITESSIMADPQSALGVLNDLHDMGLHLSVDDFGTGYSSLSYLKKLPVSELKIDKSFVYNMENDRDDAIIVQSTIDLAHNMGLTVVAEGVENRNTWTMLEALHCDFLQGYFISRPLPAEALMSWAETSAWQIQRAKPE
jgi:EAL domain-containing protein (putative c-di-GMP-specific phosphodiesterase class I)